MIGILLIAIGSLGAASFYVPFKKVKHWAWESYWISQGLAAWLLAPWIFALVAIGPGTLLEIISETPDRTKWLVMMFGALWGVGGLTFGLAIRYMGIALGKSLVPDAMSAFFWSILMALNIAMANIWGIFLKEWKGVSKKTYLALIVGIIVLILSTFVVKLT